MERFSFGDSPAMADSLLELVLAGKKTATSWAAETGTHGAEVGVRQIVDDSKGNPRAVIEITELSLLQFSDVDESFARDEGEGDLSLEWWRTEHERFFRNEGTFEEDMWVLCARFRLVEALG